MIVGLGTDLCEVDRIEVAIARSGRRFLERVFTEREREAAASVERSSRRLAAYFAIKESAFKTIRRGWPYGVGFTEVELADPHALCGPVLVTGRAADHARALGAVRFVGAACADDEIAAAVVVAERLA